MIFEVLKLGSFFQVRVANLRVLLKKARVLWCFRSSLFFVVFSRFFQLFSLFFLFSGFFAPGKKSQDAGYPQQSILIVN